METLKGLPVANAINEKIIVLVKDQMICHMSVALPRRWKK